MTEESFRALALATEVVYTKRGWGLGKGMVSDRPAACGGPRRQLDWPSWGTQSPNPLLKMAAGAPKVRNLCSKWQLERPKYEPFTQNGSWSAQSIKPVSKMQVGAPKVQFEIKALCFNLWVAPN